MRDLREKARAIAPALVVTALAVALLAPSGAGAQKKSGAKVISKTKSLNIAGTNATGTIVAKCPRSMAAVGGGFSSIPNVIVKPTNLLIVYESQRAGARGWRVSASQGVPDSTGKLTAYVYCRKTGAQIKEVSNTAPLAAAGRSEASASAACPAGTKVISGGYAVPPTQGGATTFLTENVKSGGRNWNVTGVRDSNAAPADGSVESIAYCSAAESSKQRRDTISVQTNTTNNITGVVETDPCTAPRNTSMGGFIAPYVQAGAERAALLVVESRRQGRGWRVLGIGSGPGGFNVSLTGFVYCR